MLDYADIRNEKLEQILNTVINNGLRAGWLSLGHNDGLENALPFLEAKKLEEGGSATSIPRSFPPMSSSATSTLTSSLPSVSFEPDFQSDQKEE